MPSRATAARWNRALKHFRFAFAHGGHANDMDTLSADVRFEPGEAGLEAVFAKLGLALERIPPGSPRAEIGRSYTPEEWRALPKPMRDYPDYVNPLFTTLFGAPACVSVYRNRVDIMVSGAHGNIWEVSEADFENALRIEAELERRGAAFIDAGAPP
jgi:hypothetical protein